MLVKKTTVTTEIYEVTKADCLSVEGTERMPHDASAREAVLRGKGGLVSCEFKITCEEMGQDPQEPQQ